MTARSLGGVALGLSLLVRIDSALVIFPLLLYVLLRRLRGDLTWRAALPLLAGFAVLALHAGLHAAFWARKYVLDIATRRYWSQPTAIWLGALALVLAAAVAVHRWGAGGRRFLEAHGPRLRRALMAVLVVLAAYACALRPLLSAWAGADGNDPARRLADPGPLLALGFGHLAAHDAQSLVRLGCLVSPLGLLLGVLGLLAALRDRRPRYLFPVPAGPERVRLLPLQGPRLERLSLRAAPVRPRHPSAALGFAASCSRAGRPQGGRRRVLAAALALALAPSTRPRHRAHRDLRGLAGRGPLRGRRGAALRPRGRGGARAAPQHPPASLPCGRSTG